jgi:hypothetical protein
MRAKLAMGRPRACRGAAQVDHKTKGRPDRAAQKQADRLIGQATAAAGTGESANSGSVSQITRLRPARFAA